MKKYAVWLILLTFTALIAFMIVTTAFQPVDSLMRPPKVEGENLSIQLAFEEKVGTDYILKRPISGNYRNAYNFIDLTGDNNDEVIVFYTKSDNLGIVRMNVLRNFDGEWKSIADFQSVHNDIQEIEFADFNGDGNKEIIVGWTVFQDSYSKLFSIYEVTENEDSVKIYPVYGDYYSMFKIIDIDRDGKDDILAVKYATAAGSAEYTASFLDFDEDGIREMGSFTLDKSLNSIGAINSDYIDDGTQTRIFIDGYKVDSGMITDCFVWKKADKEFSRYMVSGVSVPALTSRTSTVFCKDINSDGHIEVPTEEYLPNISDDNYARNNNLGTSLITWLWIDKDNAEFVESHIILSQYGFSFRFDSKWLDNVSVENNQQKGLLTFWSIKYVDGIAVKDEELFSIMTLSDFDLETIGELSFYYSQVNQVKGKYYYCRIYDKGSEYGITKKDIKNRMILG